jgi:hypothetical protein
MPMKHHIIIRIFFLLFLYCGAGHSQTCMDCNMVVNVSTAQDFFVSEGFNLCISPDVECSGNIFLAGGTVCNKGKINKLVIEAPGGTVYNYAEIICNQVNITLDRNVLIENYPGGVFSFNEVLSLNITPAANLMINNFKTGTISAVSSIQISGGSCTINNGRIWEPNLDLEGQGVINLTTFQVSDCDFHLDNPTSGTIFLTDDLILQNTFSKTITNSGIFTIEGDLQVEGNGDSGSLISINNSSLMAITGNLNVDLEESAVEINNVDDGSGGIEMSIGTSIIISAENCTVTNNAQLTVNNDISIQAGRLINSLNLLVEDQVSIGSAGIFINNEIADIKSLLVSAGGAVNNLSVVRIVTSMSNSGLISLGKNAAILINQYTNNGTGTIIGPTLDAAEAADKKHGKILIEGSSSHSGVITGNTFVQDNSLSCPNDYGFDVVGSGATIDDGVEFGTSCSGGVVVYNCGWQVSSNSLVATGPSGTICPYGPAAIPAPLQGQLYRTAGVPGVYPTPVPGMSYTWQPGGFVGQNFQPTVTGVYTVSTLFNGCMYTATVQVYVMNVQAPSITYTTAPYMPTPGAVFTPTLVGQTGGVWTIGPNNAPYVTINSSNGQITAYGPQSYGIYDVCYSVPGFSADGGYCAPRQACTQVTLSSAECPFFITDSVYTLCPEDKIVLNVSGGFGTYYWSPPPASPTIGLSCTACPTPTFVYDGTTSQVVVHSIRDGVTCGTGTITFQLKEHCQKDEIIGCCFSNYGAAVWVNDDNTHINIHCNLVNELGITNSVIQKGEFVNEDGFVRVSLDWIHNAKNNLYISYVPPASIPDVAETGTTVLFGFDQKVKGNSNTHFYELRLENSSNKSLWIDEYAHSDLYLNDAAMEIQNNMFLMKNDGSNIQRTSGFATTGVYGYFTRAMKNGTITKHYLYPLGGKGSSTTQLRYRPAIIQNKATTQTDEIAVNYMNIPPSLSTDPVFTHVNHPNSLNVITALAPNVQIRYNNYYHKIKNLLTPVPQSTVNIKVYYAPGDGNYQSLSEWERDPGQTLDWWGATPGSAGSTQVSTAPETPGLLYAQSEGGHSFAHTPFALARGGFYVNTTNFGNNGGGSGGAVITVSPTGSGPGTPQGGGLGAPFGTGSNSGNGGNGGNTMYTPNPVAGEYVMTISPPNDCGVEGKVKFYVDQNGYINPDLVEYRNSNNTPLGPLSSEVFSVDVQNSGISFKSSPSDLLRSCVNSITITTSTNSDFILSSGSDNLIMNLPTASSGNTITYGQIKFYNMNGTLVYATTPGPSLSIYSNLIAPGPYKFEMLVTATGLPPVSEVVTGHIIKQ